MNHFSTEQIGHFNKPFKSLIFCSIRKSSLNADIVIIKAEKNRSLTKAHFFSVTKDYCVDIYGDGLILKVISQ